MLPPLLRLLRAGAFFHFHGKGREQAAAARGIRALHWRRKGVGLGRCSAALCPPCTPWTPCANLLPLTAAHAQWRSAGALAPTSFTLEEGATGGLVGRGLGR